MPRILFRDITVPLVMTASRTQQTSRTFFHESIKLKTLMHAEDSYSMSCEPKGPCRRVAPPPPRAGPPPPPPPLLFVTIA